MSVHVHSSDFVEIVVPCEGVKTLSSEVIAFSPRSFEATTEMNDGSKNNNLILSAMGTSGNVILNVDVSADSEPPHQPTLIATTYAAISIGYRAAMKTKAFRQIGVSVKTAYDATSRRIRATIPSLAVSQIGVKLNTT